MGDPRDNRRGDRRTPVGLVVRLAYGSAEEFGDRFAVNLSRGGVFIRTRQPAPVGTPLAFELLLATGEAVVRGEGVVRWVRADDPSARPPRPPGMGVQFTSLDEPSRALVERIVAGREARPVAPPVLGPPPAPAAPEPHRPEAPSPLGPPSRAVIGIDLGTSNACAAVVRGGRPYVIPSREGHATVPSVVSVNARDAVVVGHPARAQLLVNPAGTVHGAKRLMGRRFDSPVVQELRGKFDYQIVEGPAGEAAVRLGGRTLGLEEVSALVLREVREVAQDHLGEAVNRAVITVPAYFDERQREAVRQAGALAGLRVERILNEPTAAALAYAYGRRVQQRVLVYDLGGGTFDASVLELQDNVYEVVSTGGDGFLGGVDFDARITATLRARFEAQAGGSIAEDRVALSRLTDAAERAKCALSERTEVPVQLPCLGERGGRPVALDTVLSRAEVAGLVEPLVDRTIALCREVLAARRLGPRDLDEVILVGGQSRMPLVHQKVADFFGRPPSRAVHPDEAVAIGAALLADSLDRPEGVVLIDVLPMSIGVGLPGGGVKVLIDRNTPLPVRKQYGLATTQDGQTELEVVVVQGEADRAEACAYLGTVRLTGLPPGPRGMIKVALTFALGAECLLTVTAREMNTGRTVEAVLSTQDGQQTAIRRLEAAAQGGGRGGEIRGAGVASPGTASQGGPPEAGAAVGVMGAAGPEDDEPAGGRGFWALVRRLLGRPDGRG